MLRFFIQGLVREAETGIPLPGLFVKAYDKDLLFDDLLGSAFTGVGGSFEIVTEASDFRDLFERKPDLYLRIYAPDRETLLFSTKDAVRWNAGRYERFDVAIPRDRLGESAPPGGAELLGDDGAPRTTFQAGESLTLQVKGVRPATVHRVTVSDDGGELFTDVLISDAYGVIQPTVIWPLLGLEDPREGGRLRVEEAHARWRGRRLRLTIHDGDRGVAELPVEVDGELSRPLAVSTDGEGFLLNGFEVGQHDARLSLYAIDGAESVRVFMVPRQHDWRPGDPIRPVTFADAEVAGGRADVTVARAQELRPGAYDFVVRRLRYGYEDDDDLVLRDEDVVGGHRITGLVVREPFMPSKAIQGGCTNILPIAGRSISGPPYFQFSDVFQVGEDVYGALDPAALDPALVGKMVAAYVVKHKDAAGWADPSLQHLAVLGGNASTQKWLTQSFCINANKRLLWPAATQVGEYDVVADFGNNAANPGAFVADHKYDMPLDVIDGYINAGFRVVPDPAVDTSFAHAGTFEYSEATQGSLFVTEDGESVPLRAVVWFPADAPGAITVGQVSMKQASYPLVVAVHGNSWSGEAAGFRGYNYLLQHLARNGFIVASIYQNYNMGIRGRARVLRKHLQILYTLFGVRAAANVGIMGHSRGGEAVYQAAGLNIAEAWGYTIKAVVSLAPTAYNTPDTFANPWSAPFLAISVALDGDLSAPSDNGGFALYDHAAPAPRSMAWVYGGCHTRFNTEWGETDVTGGNVHPTDRMRIVSAAAHQAIAKGYMAAFFRQHQRGEAQWSSLFQGAWIPASVQAAAPGIRICMQYEQAPARTVDDFEGAHTPTSWQISTIGGAVSQSGMAVGPQEDVLWDVDSHSPHPTAGLQVEWDTVGDALRWDVPLAQKDVSGYAALSFRIGQVVNDPMSPVNPDAQPQDLRVTLTDKGGNSRAIRVSKFFEVPFPEKQVYELYMTSAMRTVRIPLHAWTIRCVGVPEVDLKKIESVRFEFAETAKGRVAIDSLQFTD